jgi:hypothetical protein
METATPPGYASVMERMDALIGELRRELLARMDKLATTDALTTLTARVGRMEDRLESMPRRPVDAERLEDVTRRLVTLESAPDRARDRRRSDIAIAATVMGVLFGLCSIGQWAVGLAIALLPRILK